VTIYHADDFNRADGALGAGYSIVAGSAAIIGNKAVYTGVGIESEFTHTSLAGLSLTNLYVKFTLKKNGGGGQYGGANFDGAIGTAYIEQEFVWEALLAFDPEGGAFPVSASATDGITDDRAGSVKYENGVLLGRNASDELIFRFPSNEMQAETVVDVHFHGNENASIDSFEVGDDPVEWGQYSDGPYLVARGIDASSTGAGATPTLPGGIVAGDLILIPVETAGGETPTISAANGFAAVTGAVASTGSGTSGTRISLFGKIAAGSDSAPVFDDAGDHIYVGRPIVIRRVYSEGTLDQCFGTPATAVKSSASTSFSLPGVTTTSDGSYVLSLMATSTDGTFAAIDRSNSAKGSGTGPESFLVYSHQVDTGNGGGITVFLARAPTAGAIGGWTGTVASSSLDAYVTVELVPAVPRVINYLYDRRKSFHAAI
jgi:hypothetical protein